MFGASSIPSVIETDEEEEYKNMRKEMHESATVTNLLSDQVRDFKCSFSCCIAKLTFICFKRYVFLGTHNAATFLA